MKRYTILSACFFCFAFTKPAASLSPGLNSNIASVAATSSNTVLFSAARNDVTNSEVNSKAIEKAFDNYVEDSFDEMDLRGKGLKLSIYRNALVGYHNLKRNNQLSAYKSIISIVDLGKSGRQKRLWIIDLKTKKLLFHTLVAHGRGSGDDMANIFSNNVNSYQSSLGFYVTNNTYFGKHGLSLKLTGKDAGFNTNAMQRAIVVHGADYVSKDFIKRQGRLGRSQGCPAIPVELSKDIINVIKDRTCLYIDGGVDSYSSVYLDKALAVTQFGNENNMLQTALN